MISDRIWRSIFHGLCNSRQTRSAILFIGVRCRKRWGHRLCYSAASPPAVCWASRRARPYRLWMRPGVVNNAEHGGHELFIAEAFDGCFRKMGKRAEVIGEVGEQFQAGGRT